MTWRILQVQHIMYNHSWKLSTLKKKDCLKNEMKLKEKYVKEEMNLNLIRLISAKESIR